MAVRGKVKAVDPNMHKSTPVYSGDDIALGITFQLAIGERRSVVIQTHVVRDAEPQELNAVFDKIATALDRVEAKYRIKELTLLRDQRLKALKDSMENTSLTTERWERAHANTNRRGPFKPDGSQQTLLENMQKSQDQVRNDISNLNVELEAVGKIIGAT